MIEEAERHCAGRLFPDDLSIAVGVPWFIVYRLWLQPW
jgi:hypothetical protein